uniref:Uncharacterized protein n=4 Tax=unclassified bacterial viruses TaxID=12333 RepID=A0AAU6W3X0_9VIRU
MARLRQVQQQAWNLRRVEAGRRAKAPLDDRPVRFEISGVDQMSLTIISSQMTGIFKRLHSLGMVDAQSVKFIRQPVRIKGIWQCEVML